jgi:hypothetical protein
MNAIKVYNFCPVQEATGHLNVELMINIEGGVTHEARMTKREAVHHHHPFMD